MIRNFRKTMAVASMSMLVPVAGAVDHGAGDPRALVRFPEPLRIHMLANMRSHLQALQEIQAALGDENYARAGDVAEARIGMDSLRLHGAHEIGPYMPEGMRAVGSAMHRSASRFAMAAHEAAATGDVKPALGALAVVTQYCVACHAAYRVQ